jgi:hypothetical protein
MKRAATIVLMCLLIAGAALAQEATVEVPFSTPAPLSVVTPEPNDARTATCSASTVPNFAPYVVRPGDRLSDLIAGQTTVTVTQLAVLNCIDDPNALPVGAVIWLPALQVVAAATPDVTTEAAVEATAEATIEATTEPPAEATAEATSGTLASATVDVEDMGVYIASFSASSESINNTEPVTLSWTAFGDNAYFYLCAVDECMRPVDAQALPLDGAITFNSFSSAGTYRYRLDVDGVGGPMTQDVSVTVTCAQAWLGGVGSSPICPEDPPRTVYAVWQQFEHGVMLWFSDTAQVFVMDEGGRLRVYEDNYIEGQPDPAEQAPDGRFTPVRGFGVIWSALGGADSPLGWATTREVGYDGARQAAGHTSYTTYIQGPGSTVYAVTQLPGAEIGYWAQVAW